MAIRIQRSSGNVFADMGFPREEAAHLLIRADLMIQVTRLIAERSLTQKQAAKALGVTQPRISDLVRGRIELFSIDTGNLNARQTISGASVYGAWGALGSKNGGEVAVVPE